MTLLTPDQATFEVSVDVTIVGGGGCGLSAALSAHQAGAEVLVLERDPSTLGTTAMSTGLIPAAGSRLQKAAGIDDSPSQFANDILAKAKGQTDLDIVAALAVESAATVDWLADCGVPLSLVDSFLYPGHTAMRMHGTPNRTGAELMGSLSQATERADIGVLTEATVTDLFADNSGRIHGVRCRRPDGSHEDVGCGALVLACCGFAGNSQMLSEYIPEIVAAEFFGHPGNKGDAIRWGRELGAAIEDIHSYQGHGGLAAGYGIPILWPVIMEGGFQVNADGKRFSDESKGYSEQAVEVVAQPGHVAWTLYDERLHQLMQEFDDYRDAIEAKAIRSAATVPELCETLGLPSTAVEATFAEVAHATTRQEPDSFGRRFAKRSPLSAPFYGVKVAGALFHTQGGLVVDRFGQVKRKDGTLLPNLFAGGGAARGVSGPSCWGYLAGNGLLTATTFGRLAGTAAAKLTQD